MTHKLQRFRDFFMNPRNLFLIGLVITILLTYIAVIRERNFNFMIFRQSTLDFWAGINPYGTEWVGGKKHDVFLYAPLFSILFAPFAFLPAWLGSFVWNIFNYITYFATIFYLPNKYRLEQKCKTFLYTFLILATAQLFFQYNVTVATIFILSYGLLERGKSFWAIVLILISGFTKIYGIFELGLLVCYPRFWRNLGYTLFISVIFFLLPAIKLGFSELIPYYQSWIDGLINHENRAIWPSIFHLRPLTEWLLPYMTAIQLGCLALIAGTTFISWRKFHDWRFRAQLLAIIMGWSILFSNSPETNTYVIALLGYMLWYWSRTPQKIDQWLFWANFIVLVVVPVDLLCPVPIMLFINETLQLNVWIFTITWFRMFGVTLTPWLFTKSA